MKVEREVSSSPSAELSAHCGEPTWFCLRTHLKHEHIAAAHLRRIHGLDVFNPQLRLLRATRTGQKTSTEPLFPNYIFARFVLESLLEKISYTPGVKFVLRFGDRVPDVPAAVIQNLREDLAELAGEVVIDTPAEGEEIQIAQGAFANTMARVCHVLPGRARAKVLIDVMGRLVPAELNLNLVRFNRRNAAEIALKKAAETAVIQAAHGMDLGPRLGAPMMGGEQPRVASAHQ